MNPLLLTLIFTTWDIVSCLSSGSSTNSNETDFRLPKTVDPTKYSLVLKTYLPGFGWKEDEKSLIFEGLLSITADVLEETDQIVLHADSLVISDVVISVPGNRRPVEILEWEMNPELQFITLFLNDTIERQEGINIDINYVGAFRTDLKGFYLTRSRGVNGEEVLNAVTQLESTAARFMVPCFDEPEFKATWTVTVEHPTGSVALSNGIETRTETIDAEWQRTEYKETVKMSSYLLAVFVGDVQYRETTTNKGLRIRVYAEPTSVGMVEHALNVSRATVEGFEERFGIPYPMEKIDFVAAHDFAAGAMENWGLIVHKDAYLIGTNDDITSVVIHELAHQWFGNLVTMEFWDQLWLNEGFADYMTVDGTVHWDSELNRDTLSVETQEKAFWVDSDQAIEGFVREKDGNIRNTELVYSKGSSFIRMIEKIVGLDRFNEALRYYLTINQYGNVRNSDLYDAITIHQSPDLLGPDGKPFRAEEFARCWTHQNAYPTIHVEKLGTGNNTSLYQKMGKRVAPEYRHLHECGHKWDVPIWYQRIGSEEVEMTWLGKDQDSIEIESDVPVIINADSNGYYRVSYDQSLYTPIAEALAQDPTKYSEATKLRFLNDMSARTTPDFIKTEIETAAFFFKEENDLIRTRALSILKALQLSLRQLLIRTENDLELANKTLSSVSTKSIFDGCSETDSFAECTKKSSKSFNCFGVKNEAEASVERLLKWLLTEQELLYRVQMIQFLFCADPTIISKIRNETKYHWTKNDLEMFDRLSIAANPSLQKFQSEFRSLSSFRSPDAFSHI